MTSKARIQQAFGAARRAEKAVRRDARVAERQVVAGAIARLVADVRPLFNQFPPSQRHEEEDVPAARRWSASAARANGATRVLGPIIQRAMHTLTLGLAQASITARRRAYLKAINATAVGLVHAGATPRRAHDPVAVLTHQPLLRAVVQGREVDIFPAPRFRETLLVEAGPPDEARDPEGKWTAGGSGPAGHGAERLGGYTAHRSELARLPRSTAKGSGPRVEDRFVTDLTHELSDALKIDPVRARPLAEALLSAPEYLGEKAAGARLKVVTWAGTGAQPSVQVQLFVTSPGAVNKRGDLLDARWVLHREWQGGVPLKLAEPTLLYLHPDLRAQHIGTRYLADTERALATAGIDGMQLRAHSEPNLQFVGAYVWAKQGYDFIEPSRRQMVGQFNDQLAKRYPDAPKLGPSTTAKEMADYTFAGKALGKRFLLGQMTDDVVEWVGRKRLGHLQEAGEPISSDFKGVRTLMLESGVPALPNEPAEPEDWNGKRRVARVVILEPDGRVWLVRYLAGASDAPDISNPSLREAYDPDEARGEHGKWTGGTASSAFKKWFGKSKVVDKAKITEAGPPDEPREHGRWVGGQGLHDHALAALQRVGVSEDQARRALDTVLRRGRPGQLGTVRKLVSAAIFALAEMGAKLTHPNEETPGSWAYDPEFAHAREAGPPDEAREHGRWTTGGVPYTPALRPERGESTIALGKRLEQIDPETRVWVYHVTDQKTADKFAAEGIHPAEKPSNYNRQLYEQGKFDAIFYQPGVGLSPALTVGMSPQDVDGYGRVLVAVRVRFGDIQTSPEALDRGNKTGGAALAINDAQVVADISPKDIRVIPSRNNRIDDWKIPYWKEAFDPAKHPHEPGGTPEGGRWAPAGDDTAAAVTKSYAKAHPFDIEKSTVADLTQYLDKLRSLGGKDDLCLMIPKLCAEGYGVARGSMPQFPKAQLPGLMDTLRGMGIGIQDTAVSVRDLRGTQGEISGSKVAQVATKMLNGTYVDPERPLLVSSDNYVLDGHHRWAAQWLAEPEKPIPVTRIMVPIRDLFPLAKRLSAYTRKFGEAARDLMDAMTRNTLGWQRRLEAKIRFDMLLGNGGIDDEI